MVCSNLKKFETGHHFPFSEEDHVLYIAHGTFLYFLKNRPKIDF